MTVTGNGTAQSNLGGAAGYGEIAVPRNDDGSFQVNAGSIFSDGLNYFGNEFSGDQIYVNTNGTISFDVEFDPYPQVDDADPEVNFLAPFWADVDTRLDGEAPESGQIWVDLDAGNDVLSVTWHNVGAYRRNAEVANLFQVQLYDRGDGDFDVVYRFQTIEWSVGTGEGDVGGKVGLAAEDAADSYWPTTPADPLSLPQTAGNTGVAGLWVFEFRDGQIASGGGGGDTPTGVNLLGTAGNDELNGTDQDDLLDGSSGNDTLRGQAGADTIIGGDGADTLNGGDGADTIRGGASALDVRDVIYAGAGNDTIDAGYGNDLVYGQDGSDILIGGFGADELFGQNGNDTLSGSALSDLIFGGDGNDFINGGFGYDRINGGAGADRFYHLGVADHGSDWIQDYDLNEGDLLSFGNENATPDDFQVNYAFTANAGAEQSAEAFVIYRPTGLIVWALIDGSDHEALSLQIGTGIFQIS